MKQTAVEWYFDKMKSHFEHDGDLYEVFCITYQLAKEKEKLQMMDCYLKADIFPRKYEFEKYYNETYKQD